MAGYYRRAEDYVLQANLATSELEQYGRQIVSSLLREQIAQAGVREPPASDRAAPSPSMRSSREKFTNEELYTWMHGRAVADATTSCYKLAFDVAKRAEQTLKHELMRPEFDELSIIKFGYWDAGRKGLLAGEHAVRSTCKRLEMAYLEHEPARATS